MSEPAAATSRVGPAGSEFPRSDLYAGVGSELVHYEVDVEGTALIKRGSVRLPAGVQYAWPHATRPVLYVASSDKVPKIPGAAGHTHHVSAFRIDPGSGALHPLGQPLPLRHRPIHLTTDIPSEYVLIAYCDPSSVSVHRINRAGAIGEEIEQQAALDFGIYAHQIRIAPSNTMAIVAARGPGKAEDPGALKVFKYRNGMLSDGISVGGPAFGPRHLDFHPAKPWIYVSLEHQHKVCLFTCDGDRLSPKPVCARDTLAHPENVQQWQAASTIHVHPNGRFVYGGERGTREIDGNSVYAGGEDTILTYAIDDRSGEPTLIQRIDTRGMHPRTFAIDASGRLLVAANKSPVPMADGSTVPASLDVFRIRADGTLAYVRKYDIDVGSAALWWMGIVARRN